MQPPYQKELRNLSYTLYGVLEECQACLPEDVERSVLLFRKHYRMGFVVEGVQVFQFCDMQCKAVGTKSLPEIYG